MKAAVTEAQQVLADMQGPDAGTFKIAGKCFNGTPSLELQGQTLMVGGNLVTLEKTISAPADQFTTGVPLIGSPVLHVGTTYKLVKIGKDGLSLMFYLETPQQ